MTTSLTKREVAWVLALAEARVKKQKRRIDNYEKREGDDTEHFDVLAVNLAWMEDATRRLTAVLTEVANAERYRRALETIVRTSKNDGAAAIARNAINDD